MMKLIIPVVAVLGGAGAGVGAGLFTQPKPTEADGHGDAHQEASKDDGHTSHQEDSHETSDKTAHGNDAHAAAPKDSHEDGHGATGAGYVKIPSQFVVPVVNHGKVKALAIVSISLEIDEAYREDVTRNIPKIKALTLQTLLNHAALGGFDGNFADLTHIKELSRMITDRLKQDITHGIHDTLLLELARQDL